MHHRPPCLRAVRPRGRRAGVTRRAARRARQPARNQAPQPATHTWLSSAWRLGRPPHRPRCAGAGQASRLRRMSRESRRAGSLDGRQAKPQSPHTSAPPVALRRCGAPDLAQHAQRRLVVVAAHRPHQGPAACEELEHLCGLGALIDEVTCAGNKRGGEQVGGCSAGGEYWVWSILPSRCVCLQAHGACRASEDCLAYQLRSVRPPRAGSGTCPAVPAARRSSRGRRLRTGRAGRGEAQDPRNLWRVWARRK